jgi:hypothetical protein
MYSAAVLNRHTATDAVVASIVRYECTVSQRYWLMRNAAPHHCRYTLSTAAITAASAAAVPVAVALCVRTTVNSTCKETVAVVVG